MLEPVSRICFCIKTVPAVKEANLLFFPIRLLFLKLRGEVFLCEKPLKHRRQGRSTRTSINTAKSSSCGSLSTGTFQRYFFAVAITFLWETAGRALRKVDVCNVTARGPGGVGAAQETSHLGGGGYEG